MKAQFIPFWPSSTTEKKISRQRFIFMIMIIIALIGMYCIIRPLFYMLFFPDINYVINLKKFTNSAKSHVSISVWHFHHISSIDKMPIVLCVEDSMYSVEIEDGIMVVTNAETGSILDHFRIDADIREHYSLVFLTKWRYSRSVEYYDDPR